MSDSDDFWASTAFVVVCLLVVTVVWGVLGTCRDVSDLKQSVCALNYHAATTASDSLSVQRSSACPLPSTNKPGQ
jgi:hypothetical protein